MDQDYIVKTIGERKKIALIAHDAKKDDLLRWCVKNKDRLKDHDLFGTGTTAAIISYESGLYVRGVKSGPLGGDQQIGAKIVEEEIDFVVFFADPMTAQPHDPDVKALMRIGELYDIPMAINEATADFMITSPFMTSEYKHKLVDFAGGMEKRIKSFIDKKSMDVKAIEDKLESDIKSDLETTVDGK